MKVTDTYRTIKKPVIGEVFKDKGSKFIGYAYPVRDKTDIKERIEVLKEEHYKARHWCYAWRLGVDNFTYRVSDDGEPNNSAGNPIYGQINSHDLTQILVVVVRYFGGTKLGVGGLINAYRTAAKLALVKSQIVKKTIDVIYSLSFEYKNLNKVMQLIKEKKIPLIDQEMNLKCVFKISVRLSEAPHVKRAIENLRCVELKS